jgi:pimeloyl-ACP methyl ester carboxylesterase
MRAFVLAALLFASPVAAQTRCGEIVTIDPSAGGKFVLSIAEPDAKPKVVLILLPGGNGLVDLDDDGCARALKGNSLIRAIPEFNKGGAVTAVADAPAEWRGRDGLAAFRAEPAHAQALGVAVADLRKRFGVPVWLVGTSRGAISAANAASRLDGDARPDGVVLTSPVSAGARANQPWVLHDVFMFPLERISIPLLVLGHAKDMCLRSPPANVPRIAEKASAAPRKQAAIMEGGPGSNAKPGDLAACEGRQPHGFLDQESDMAAGILRFVAGARF